MACVSYVREYYSKMLNAYIIKTLEFLLVVWKVFLTNWNGKVTDFQDFLALLGGTKGKTLTELAI